MRTIGDPLAMVPFVAEAVTEVHARAQIDNSAEMAQARLYVGVVGFFAGLGLFLTAFGMYAPRSYTVGAPAREMGVRMARGAQTPRHRESHRRAGGRCCSRPVLPWVARRRGVEPGVGEFPVRRRHATTR